MVAAAIALATEAYSELSLPRPRWLLMASAALFGFWFGYLGIMGPATRATAVSRTRDQIHSRWWIFLEPSPDELRRLRISASARFRSALLGKS